MKKKPLPKIYIVVGPTASGKSALAVKLAKQIKGEILSTDSRQIYKYLNIGSAKITKKEMQNIKHYGLDIVDPIRASQKYLKTSQNFSVQDYLKYAKQSLDEIFKKNKTPILCGGTGLYIEAILYGLPKNAKVNPSLRKTLATKSLTELLEIIQKLNQEKYLELTTNPNTSERNNRRRLIRIIEILETKKRNQQEIKISPKKNKLKYSPEFIFLDQEKDKLREKIAIRLEKRLTARGKNNLINEVKYLREELKISDTWLLSLGLEYKYVTLYLENKITLEGMQEEILNKSWQYAKRQITWNKRYQKLALDRLK